MYPCCILLHHIQQSIHQCKVEAEQKLRPLFVLSLPSCAGFAAATHFCTVYNMSVDTLKYEPSWHHIGNPDTIPMALAYGTLALAAIILLEYISAGILFSKAKGILISDAAAAVTFSNASWFDLGQWAFVNKPARRICKRAVLAIFLRYFIFALDILILVVSIPRSIPVFEREVGSSVMTFPNGVISTNVNELAADFFNAPCRPDPIIYEGFKPDATRQLCFSGLVAEGSLNKAEYASIGLDRNDVYVVGNSEGNRALQVVYVNLEMIFTYSHIMRVENTRYLLPPRPGIVDEYAQRLVGLKENAQCKSVKQENIVTEMFKGTRALIVCTKDSSLNGALYPQLLFSFMNTRALRAGEARNKYKNLNELVPPGLFKVGSIDRPRVCVIPAVIMFLSLLVVASIVRITKGKQDLAFKLWSFVSRAYGSDNIDNPLYSECSEFERWNTDDGSISTFHQSHYTQDVKSTKPAV